jgi:hypothetical protein
MQYPGVIEKKGLTEVISMVLEKLAASPKERPNAMFRRVKSLIGHYKRKPDAIGKPVSALRKISIASQRSREESLSRDFIREEAALLDVARPTRQRFVYGSETAKQEVAALAGLKENEEVPSELRQTISEILAARELPTGEPSPQELEAINAEVLRRGREFLQNITPRKSEREVSYQPYRMALIWDLTTSPIFRLMGALF